ADVLHDAEAHVPLYGSRLRRLRETVGRRERRALPRSREARPVQPLRHAAVVQPAEGLTPPRRTKPDEVIRSDPLGPARGVPVDGGEQEPGAREVTRVPAQRRDVAAARVGPELLERAEGEVGEYSRGHFDDHVDVP